jgi:hypothetical protein
VKALWARRRHLMFELYMSGVLTYMAIGLTKGWFR